MKEKKSKYEKYSNEYLESVLEKHLTNIKEIQNVLDERRDKKIRSIK